jgi:pimeloyl-ACP methyl ester carboxylesterase
MFRHRTKAREVRIGKCRLVYRQYGSGPPLLLIHGLAGSGGWWRRNRTVFAEHFTVYVIDLVGYGGNRAFRPLRIAETAACLAEFIANLPGGCAHVVAHSMGGQICTHLAAEHPERVNRLVLAAASGLLRSDLLRMMLRLPGAARYSRLDFAPTLAYDSLRSGPLNLLLSALDILSDDVSDALAGIVAPTLLLWGAQDTLVPVSVAEAVHKAIPTSRLEIIPRAGHVLMWDQPTEFNRLVLEFLEESKIQSPKPRTENLTENIEHRT